jgi:hypothetical protein
MIIYIENFYKNCDKIFNAVSRLDFITSTYGSEVKNFHMVPENIENEFSMLLNHTNHISSPQH